MKWNLLGRGEILKTYNYNELPIPNQVIDQPPKCKQLASNLALFLRPFNLSVFSFRRKGHK